MGFDSLSNTINDLMLKTEMPLTTLNLSKGIIPSEDFDLPKYRISDLAIPDMASGSTKYGWHQLIVIGNGFDKACTLRSGYGDFFATRKEKLYPSIDAIVESTYETWGAYIAADGITVWDLIIEEDPDVLWNDVEQAIQRWIVCRSSTIPGSDPFSRTISLLNPERLSDIPSEKRACLNWPSYENRDSRSFKEMNIAQFILDNNTLNQGEWTEEIFTTYLLSELHRLEVEFSKYLLHEVEENSKYEEMSKSLLIDLLVEELPTSDDASILTSVLNFNYTSPSLPTFRRNDVEIDMTNIHGKLGEEIVFGIDGKDCMNEELVVPFTKTYRLLGLHTTDGNRFFESVGSFSGSSPLNVIKVFGHSLASPDYSYFQALFDSVDLYGGSVKLIFYYRDHKEGVSADANMFKSVTRLMNAYGSTMDNKDHGKNLMHKLLLEGRLSVKRLKHFRVGSVS